jgi:branched-chain amino acid transport system substrate-binding protein
MRKLSVISIVICFWLLFFSGSGNTQRLAPYPIGFVLDLTGPASSLGIPEKRIAEIEIYAINSVGGINGRELKAIFYDSETDASKAVLHTKRLIDVDKVIICAGYSTSGTTMASIKTAETGETVLFSAASCEKIWIPTKKWIFNVVPRQKEASIPILLENLLHRGSKKIAYIYIDNVYGQTGKETFDWAVKELKITPAIVEKYAPGSTDVTPQITHIKAAGTDGLLITGLLADTVMVIKAARDLGFTPPIVSDYAVVGPEFVDLAGKYGEGIVSTSLKTLVTTDLPNTDIQKMVCRNLYSKYTERFGIFSLYSGHAWDQVNIIVEALKKVDPKLDPAKEKDLLKIREQLRDNLEKIKGFVGQNGIFNYSPDNHNGLGPKCYVPVVVEEGTWTLYKGK